MRFKWLKELTERKEFWLLLGATAYALSEIATAKARAPSVPQPDGECERQA